MPDVPLPAILDSSWAAALDAAAAAHSDRAAFHFDGPAGHQSLSFTDWLRASRQVAAALRALGIERGDRVGVLAPGSALWPIMQTACSHLGAIIVPINTRYRADELGFVLGRATPKVIVLIEKYHTTDYLQLVEDVAPESTYLITLSAPVIDLHSAQDHGDGRRRSWGQFLALGRDAHVPDRTGTADDPVLLQFTSGTSAFPKGALLNSRATLGATWYIAERMRVTSEDVYFSTQPMYHVGGSVATTLMALGAAPTMIVPERYSPETVFDLIPRYRCTARTGQAAMYAMELAHPDFRSELFSTLRAAWSGGNPELRKMISQQMGVPVMTTIYGLTETAGTTTITDIDDQDDVWVHSCGQPIPGVEVAIRTDSGITLEPDIEGEIVVRGWSVMIGYYEDPEATANAIDRDGWFSTGDLGRLDDTGNLFYVDRIKDMIKPGGENVSAAEVERVIQGAPGVVNVAVVGRPDERLGQVPVAFVQSTASPFDPQAVIDHCAAVMASFKVPREVFQVETFPMTESGKILKRELAAQFGNATTGRLVGQAG